MRIAFSLGVWIALATAPMAAQEGAPLRAAAVGQPGCAGEVLQDRLEDITAEGDLLLGSQGLARLAGVRLPDGPRERRQALAWLKDRLGLPLLVTPQGPRDRWGRLPVQARIPDKPSDLGLARELVEAGVAIVDGGVEDALCQPELLVLEEAARQRRLGLWSDDRYNPIPVDQTDRLKEHVGSFVIVEGRVRSVGERKQRTYLNFGGHWADDFTIIIPKNTWLRMSRRGLAADTLKGRIIRARGILQSWQGPALTIDAAEMIERLEDGNPQGGRREEKRPAR